MIIEAGRTVALEYTVWDSEENELDSNVADEPLVYLHGDGQIIPGLEKELEGMREGEGREIEVFPHDAYGEISDENLVAVPTSDIPEEARKEGAHLETTTDEGETLSALVVQVGEEDTVLDFNHPLAGQTLRFAIRVLAVQM